MKFILIITLATLTLFAQAAPQYGTVTVSKVINVYDGDTFRVNIDSLPPIVGKNIPIRVNGVDTPDASASIREYAEEGWNLFELWKY